MSIEAAAPTIRLTVVQRLALLALSLGVGVGVGVGAAHANTWLAVSGAGSQGAPISIYPSNASGNLAPSATIQGNAVNINGCTSLDHDPLADEVYCADFSGQALAIFAANASGNVAPLRRITSAQAIGQLRAATRLGASEELAVLRSFGAGIRILPRGGNGEVQALRSISGSNTQLDNPLKIVFLPASNELAISDFSTAAGITTGEVVIFPAGGSGNLAPSRRITSPAMGQQTADLLWTPRRPAELFVLVADPSVGGIMPLRVVVFAVDAAGVSTPLREIAGSLTRLTNFGKLAYVASRDELLVTTNLFNGLPEVLAFPAGGNGNIAPTRALAGASVGGPFYAAVDLPPSEQIFANGFEP